MHVDAFAMVNDERPRVVNAMHMVGMRMRQDDGVEMIDIRRQQLLAHVGRHVDEHAGHASLALALDQQ